MILNVDIARSASYKFKSRVTAVPLLGYVRDFSLEKALRDSKSFVVLSDVGTFGSEHILVRCCCIGEVEFQSAKVGEMLHTFVGRVIFDDPFCILPAKCIRRVDVYLHNFISS